MPRLGDEIRITTMDDKEGPLKNGLNVIVPPYVMGADYGGKDHGTCGRWRGHRHLKIVVYIDSNL